MDNDQILDQDKTLFEGCEHGVHISSELLFVYKFMYCLARSIKTDTNKEFDFFVSSPALFNLARF